jgi:hypothetical protein
LTALEISLGHLQHDCEVIARKRQDVVQSVIETQYGNVSHVQEVRTVCITQYLSNSHVSLTENAMADARKD